jgi:hypothetical protein
MIFPDPDPDPDPAKKFWIRPNSDTDPQHWLQTHPSIPSALQIPSADTQKEPKQIIWGSFSSSTQAFCLQ